MQRLVYIANIRLPTEKAHGIQIMKTCEALAKQGIGVELIVAERKNPLEGNPFSFYGVKQNFKFHRVRCLDFLVLPFWKKIGFVLQSFSFYFSVKRYLSNHLADIYYTRDLIIAFFLTRLYSPVFYEIHNLPSRATWFHRRAWERASGLIVISNGLKDELMRYGIPDKKIMVAHDAVDDHRFMNNPELQSAFRELLELPKGKKIVVYTGHLYEWKGANVLAEAAKLLPADIHVYVVGGTPEDTKIFKKKYENVKNLHIEGWKAHTDIPVWQTAADILVLPTSGKEKIGRVYTSPIKLFEYMMSKHPIVASDIPSLREVLDESTATFFKSDDPASLAEKIQAVIANLEEAEEKALRAYSQVLQNFTWDKRAQSILEFLRARV